MGKRAIVALAITISGFIRSVPAEEWNLGVALMNSTFKIEGPKSMGTCFLVGRPSAEKGKVDSILVTAAHVLDNMEGETATVHMRSRQPDGSFKKLLHPMKIRSGNIPLWRRHNDKSVDVAAIRFLCPKEGYVEIVSADLLARDFDLKNVNICPGDDLLSLGYPMGVSANEAGFPILRSGKVASYPILPTSVTKTMMYDFNVYPGNSGGPVFNIRESPRIAGGLKLGGRVHLIVGLVSQEAKVIEERMKGKDSTLIERTPLQLATVVHATFIRETVDLLSR